MTKQEWEELYRILDKIHSDFLLEYPRYKDGRNKKIREEAQRNIDNSLRQADYHIRKNGDAYNLLTGGDNVDAYGRTVMYEEFLYYRYFGDDMSSFLRKMREKIQTLDN